MHAGGGADDARVLGAGEGREDGHGEEDMGEEVHLGGEISFIYPFVAWAVQRLGIFGFTWCTISNPSVVLVSLPLDVLLMPALLARMSRA